MNYFFLSKKSHFHCHQRVLQLCKLLLGFVVENVSKVSGHLKLSLTLLPKMFAAQLVKLKELIRSRTRPVAFSVSFSSVKVQQWRAGTGAGL